MRHGGESALLLSAAVFGVSATLSVYALRTVRPADLLAVEISGAAAILLVTAVARRRLHGRGAWRQMLVGILVPGLAFLFGDLGLARTSASSGSLLLAAEPLLSVLLAMVVLGERLSRRAVGALALGLAGGALVALEPGAPTGGGTTLGNVLVLLAVVASALFLIATRRFNDAGDALNESAWQTVGGALSVTPFVAAAWSTGGTRLDTAGTAGWIACVAVVLCGAVGGVLFNRGIARVPAVRAGLLGNLTPVVGTLTAVAFLGDRPSFRQIAGGAAILAGLALLLHRPTPAEASGPTEPGPERPVQERETSARDVRSRRLASDGEPGSAV
ncbi:EamA family transporter [Paractinoplanes ferrugineus]|uniref:ABC transporter permease n=1 Tax=Paractinoplanes ferrugineus TaxID=113564 RepID=A0A919MBG9_9ACTN|nr:DMT family transporter [Actinoplanes ferrugineus]GIE13651.1 ABC transporter permease [Actinoplanes ferrugineus]